MDVTSLLNTAAREPVDAEREMQSVERIQSGDDNLLDSTYTPAATSASGSVTSSLAVTPPPETASPQRSRELRVLSRNRTPWDANGYHLPLMLDTGKPSLPGATGRTAATITICRDSSSPPEMTDSGCPSPKSASSRHKFSDSRSSFSSSYTICSSANSVTHSRISSLSTVSEHQPLPTLITELSLDTRITDAESSLCGRTHCVQQHTPVAETLAYGQCLQPESPTPVRDRYGLSLEASPAHSPKSPNRTRSPSDVAMFARLESVPGDAVLSLGNDRLRADAVHSRAHSRSNFLNRSPTRHHKRASSAPDFFSVSPSSFNPRCPTFGPIPEPTPSPSQYSDSNAMDQDFPATSSSGRLHPEHSSNSDLTPTSSEPNTMVPSPAASGHRTPGTRSNHPGEVRSVPANTNGEEPVSVPADFETASACMYRGDCQTGSQLRKAISHIFGRNKLCTRMIPTGVWVHYCRKHYQRTRYRNGGEYPQRQIGLVQEQVKRVQAWSDTNVRSGHGPVLKDWSLSVRKREQLRLDNKLAATGKKRLFQDEAEEEEEEAFDEDRTEMSGTAVPNWVVSRIGDGYSTMDILAVVEQLRIDIDQGRLQQIPDIEILPNIVTDSNRDDSSASLKKSYTKRRTAGSRISFGGFGPVSDAGGHRRSQSVNTSALQRDGMSMGCHQSHPNSFYPPYRTPGRLTNGSELQHPMEKRLRMDGDGGDRHMDAGCSASFESTEALSMVHGPGPHARASTAGRVQLPHRPAFSGIREGYAESHGAYVPDDAPYEGPHDSNGMYAHQYMQLPQQHHHGRPGDAAQRGEPYHGAPAGEAAPYYEGGRYYSNGPAPNGAFESSSCREYEHRGSAGGGQASYSVLSAPNPQRLGGSSMAQQLETSPYVVNSANSRRSGMHQRSQSEAVFLHHMPPSHLSRPTSSSGFAGHSSFAGGRYSHGGPENASPAYAQRVREQPEYSGYPNHGHSHSHSYSHGLGHGSRFEEERLGDAGGPPPPGYANGSEHRDRYDNVQLPPLQSISQGPLHLRQATSFAGSGAGLDRAFPPVSEHPEMSRHARHQSSPVIPRLLPPPMEVGSSPVASCVVRSLSPRV